MLNQEPAPGDFLPHLHEVLFSLCRIKRGLLCLCVYDCFSPLCVATDQAGELPYLEDVFAGSYVCNVDPLAVNVMAVGIPAANGDTLLAHVVAGEALLDTWWEIQLESDKDKTFWDFIYLFIIIIYQMFYF